MYFQKPACQSVNEVKLEVPQIFSYLAIVPFVVMFPTYDHVCSDKLFVMHVLKTSRVSGLCLQLWCTHRARSTLLYELQEGQLHILLQWSSINAVSNHRFWPTAVTIPGPTTLTPESFMLQTRTFFLYRSDFLLVTSAASPTLNLWRYCGQSSYGISCQTSEWNCFRTSTVLILVLNVAYCFLVFTTQDLNQLSIDVENKPFVTNKALATDIPDVVLVVNARKQSWGARKPKPKPILLSPSDQHRGIWDL